MTILVAPFSMFIIFAGYEDNHAISHEFDYGQGRTEFPVKFSFAIFATKYHDG